MGQMEMKNLFMGAPPPFKEGRAYCFAAVRPSLGRFSKFPFISLHCMVVYTEMKSGIQIWYQGILPQKPQILKTTNWCHSRISTHGQKWFTAQPKIVNDRHLVVYNRTSPPLKFSVSVVNWSMQIKFDHIEWTYLKNS